LLFLFLLLLFFFFFFSLRAEMPSLAAGMALASPAPGLWLGPGLLRGGQVGAPRPGAVVPDAAAVAGNVCGPVCGGLTLGASAAMAVAASRRRGCRRGGMVLVANATPQSSGTGDTAETLQTEGVNTSQATDTGPAAGEAVAPPPPPAPRPVPCACPICQTPLGSALEAGIVCKPCGLGFPKEAAGGFLDLTIGAARPAEQLPLKLAPLPRDELEQSFLQRLPFVDQADSIAERLGLPKSREVEALGREILREPQKLLNTGPLGTSTFQNPLVSFAYERGWRKAFASSGFPGPDEEFRLAQDFLSEGQGLLGDVLLDASCGSGLFSRRFASSGSYSTVVALDFSEAMLRQVDDFAEKELGADYSSPPAGQCSLQLVRADIARLPFASKSLGGVHAGAAIHCWPNPENAMAEIARVLRPGGVLVMTTFMPRGPLKPLSQGNGPYRFWEKEELRKLTRQCGLVDFEAITKDPAFIMVRVRKPRAE